MIRQRLPRLDKIAAMPSKSDPSMMTIAISFLFLHVLHLFSCRKGDSAVSVMIEAITGTAKLKVSGDIEAVLTVPFEDDDRFLVGLSDGTLLLGTYDDLLRCRWQVLQDGAGIVRIAESAVTLEWRAEWITASCYYERANPNRHPEILPLFPDLDRHAA